MAYEVTKRIKGHDYRYRVEGYRDPRNGKRRARWQYLGVLSGGELTPAAAIRRTRVTREDLIAATVRLLEYRDPSNVTVATIVRSAGASKSTFYRNFPNRRAAFSVALDRICDVTLRALPPLDAQMTDLHEARLRLRVWCEAYYRSMLQQRALRSALAQGQHGNLRARIERSLITVDPSLVISAFLRRLCDCGFVQIGDPDALARSIRAIHLAMMVASVAGLPYADIPAPAFEEVFPLIDRAVFGV
jgi:AcrR family transcriptional regulator